mmetsp:Transcript_14863/g.56326  ORF Transcript_14863/g.56326 Transcript_14863/m.56326 type:complete len:220 (-) Transcript_14863:93-752(-)
MKKLLVVRQVGQVRLCVAEPQPSFRHVRMQSRQNTWSQSLKMPKRMPFRTMFSKQIMQVCSSCESSGSTHGPQRTSASSSAAAPGAAALGLTSWLHLHPSPTAQYPWAKNLHGGAREWEFVQKSPNLQRPSTKKGHGGRRSSIFSRHRTCRRSRSALRGDLFDGLPCRPRRCLRSGPSTATVAADAPSDSVPSAGGTRATAGVPCHAARLSCAFASDAG